MANYRKLFLYDLNTSQPSKLLANTHLQQVHIQHIKGVMSVYLFVCLYVADGRPNGWAD